MENLLLESADKLLRYKGMLWIDGELTVCCSGVQRLYSADGQTVGRRNATQHAGIGIRLPGRRGSGGVCGD